MRSLAEQNYYELLEAPPEGTPQQIERAYRIARSTYQPSSAATYSLYSSEECAAILRRIEEAYSVLSDARLRREYDSRLGRTESAPAPTPASVRPIRPEAAKPLEPVDELSPERAIERQTLRAREPLQAPRPAPRTDLDVENGFAPEDGVFDGEVLRRIRVSLGIELEEISTITKINDQHLRSIEGNQYDVLPAPVYLRGFLRQIAKCLSLDPLRVADSYTNRMREISGRKG